MTALPASTDFTGASITEAQFKTAITSQREFLAGLLGTGGTVASALATLGALGSSWVSKTAAYTVLATDRGKLIGCSGTFSLTLTAAATMGDGFSFAVLNYGTGVVTIDPNSTELIDGASTITLAAGESCVVLCTGGTAWRTIGRSVSDGEFRSQQVFTSSGTYNKPAGLKRVKVTVLGGGGGSGGSAEATYNLTVSSQAGGGGGWAIKFIEAASISSSETVTIGAGGAAGASTPGAGGTGGTSSFGAHCSATGGGGGLGANDYPGSPSSASGGIGSGGTVNCRGIMGTNYEGGASQHGGCAQNTAPVVKGSGAGGRIAPSNSNVAGFAGAAGIVIVEEFF